MSHKDVLIDINEVDNVGMGAGTPVEVNLATRLGNITQNLVRKRVFIIVKCIIPHYSGKP